MTAMQMLHWLLDAQTIGGVLVLACLAMAGLTYALMLRWVLRGDEEESAE